MASKATTKELSDNAKRAMQRVESGRAYTKRSIKRLASEGVNIGQVLAKAPSGGLPGAQAGAQQLRYRARNEQQVAKIRQQTHLLALKHAYELVKQHRAVRPDPYPQLPAKSQKPKRSEAVTKRTFTDYGDPATLRSRRGTL
jgi:hypothetical protein